MPAGARGTSGTVSSVTGRPVDPDALELGAASPDDVDDVVDLVQSAYRGEPSRQGWTTEADLLEGQRVDASMVRAVIDDPDAVVLTARSAGSLVACCELRHRRGHGDAHLGMFAVRPGLQGAGTGRRMLAEAERSAERRWGVGRMSLSVIEVRHELIAWYQRRGYAPTGEAVAFPYGDERYGRPTRDDLRLVVLSKVLDPGGPPAQP